MPAKYIPRLLYLTDKMADICQSLRTSAHHCPLHHVQGDDFALTNTKIMATIAWVLILSSILSV